MILLSMTRISISDLEKIGSGTFLGQLILVLLVFSSGLSSLVFA